MGQGRIRGTTLHSRPRTPQPVPRDGGQHRVTAVNRLSLQPEASAEPLRSELRRALTRDHSSQVTPLCGVRRAPTLSICALFLYPAYHSTLFLFLQVPCEKFLFVVIFVKKAVLYSVLFVGENRLNIYILNAAEYAFLNIGIALFKLAYQLFRLLTL